MWYLFTCFSYLFSAVTRGAAAPTLKTTVLGDAALKPSQKRLLAPFCLISSTLRQNTLQSCRERCMCVCVCTRGCARSCVTLPTLPSACLKTQRENKLTLEQRLQRSGLGSGKVLSKKVFSEESQKARESVISAGLHAIPWQAP